MSHTKAPWEWEFSGTAGRWVLIHKVSEFNYDFVNVGGWPGSPLSDDQKLIQAAPDLLAACEAGIEFLPKAGSSPQTTKVRDCEVADQMRAAIAKARGKS